MRWFKDMYKVFSQCVNDGIFKEVRDVEENVDLKIVKMCSISGVPIFIDETVAETLLPIYAE